jgi:hypothetical protein
VQIQRLVGAGGSKGFGLGLGQVEQPHLDGVDVGSVRPG